MATLRHLTCLGLSLGLLTLTSAMTFVISLSQRHCLYSMVADGKLPTAAPSYVLHGVGSGGKCAVTCMTSLGPLCRSLSYSKDQRECRLYSVFNVSDVTVASPGHKYYRGRKVHVGDVCTTSGDCICTANAECRYGMCQCEAGYHFYPGNGSCLEACPNGYGEGYYTVTDRGMRYNNIGACLYVQLEAECWAACRSHSQCSSFEFDGNLCCI